MNEAIQAMNVADEVNDQPVKTEAEREAEAFEAVQSERDAEAAQVMAEQWHEEHTQPAWMGDFDDIYGGGYSEC